MRVLEQDIRVGIRRLIRRVRSSAGQIEASGKVREYLNRNLEAVEEQFKLGMATSEDVLDAQQENAEAEGVYVKRLAEHNVAWLNLQRARGLPVPALSSTPSPSEQRPAPGPLSTTDTRER